MSNALSPALVRTRNTFRARCNRKGKAHQGTLPCGKANKHRVHQGHPQIYRAVDDAGIKITPPVYVMGKHIGQLPVFLVPSSKNKVS